MLSCDPFEFSLADRQKVILSGYFGRTGRNGGIRPFDKLRVEELKKELRSRKVEPIGHKKDLEAALKELLGGVQRVPALFVNRQKASPAEMNLAFYEVLPGESLPNIKGHIKNVLDQLKYHLEKDQRRHYEDAYEAAIRVKDALRGSDLLLGLILMTVNLQGKIPPRVLELLQLLAEIKPALPSSENAIPEDSASTIQHHVQAFDHVLSYYQISKKHNV